MTTGALADLLMRTWHTDRACAEADLAGIPAELSALSRRFVALDRKMLAASQRLRLATGTAEQIAATEIQRLNQLDGITELEVDSQQLIVETRPIYIERTARRFDLGRYRILLDLAGDVRIKSLDRLGPKSHWDHPHVQAGLPCLGNLREGVLKLIAEYELALAIQVLLDFLTTYEPTTAYTPIEGWPEAR